MIYGVFLLMSILTVVCRRRYKKNLSAMKQGDKQLTELIGQRKKEHNRASSDFGLAANNLEIARLNTRLSETISPSFDHTLRTKIKKEESQQILLEKESLRIAKLIHPYLLKEREEEKRQAKLRQEEEDRQEEIRRKKRRKEEEDRRRQEDNDNSALAAALAISSYSSSSSDSSSSSSSSDWGGGGGDSSGGGSSDSF